MFQVCVLARLLALLLLHFLQHVRLVVQHVIKRVLAQVKLFGLDELLLELANVRDHPDPPTLVQITGLIYPQSFTLVVQERDLVRHDVQPIRFGHKVVHFHCKFICFGFRINLEFLQSFEQLQLRCKHTDNIWNVIGDLLALFKRVEIDFPWRLHPFEKVVRRKLILLLHEYISRAFMIALVFL